MSKFKTNYIRSMAARYLSKVAIVSDFETLAVENEEQFVSELAASKREEIHGYAFTDLTQYNKEWTITMYVHHDGPCPIGYVNIVEDIDGLTLADIHHFVKAKGKEAAARKGGGVTKIGFVLWPGKHDHNAIHTKSIGILMKHKILVEPEKM